MMVNGNLQATEDNMESVRQAILQKDAVIQMLDAALLALGAKTRPVPAPWMVPLNPQQRALMGALYAAYPNSLEREQLLQLLPSKRDELDRQPMIVNVVISRCRAVLKDKNCITNDRGVGYRMGVAFYNSIPKKELDLAA